MTMPQFDVTIGWYREVIISVEANTEEDAGKLAWNMARSEADTRRSCTLYWENDSFDVMDVELNDSQLM
jgi:hypothetical protein